MTHVTEAATQNAPVGEYYRTIARQELSSWHCLVHADAGTPCMYSPSGCQCVERMAQVLANIDAAARVRAPAADGEARTFWVVERFENGRSAGYWDGGSSRSFESNIDKAIQFCRRHDALWVVLGWHWKDVQITEHIMVGGKLAAQPKASELQQAYDAIKRLHDQCLEKADEREGQHAAGRQLKRMPASHYVDQAIGLSHALDILGNLGASNPGEISPAQER